MDFNPRLQPAIPATRLYLVNVNSLIWGWHRRGRCREGRENETENFERLKQQWEVGIIAFF